MRRREVRRWAIALTLLLGPVAVFTGYRALSRWRSRAWAETAVSGLAHCLFGLVERDGEGAEAVARKLRAHAIGADLKGESSWPGRCEPYVSASESALRGLKAEATAACGGRCCEGDATCTTIDALEEELKRARLYLAIQDKSAFDPDALVRHADALGLLVGDPDDAPEPPTPVALLDPRRMLPLYEGNYLRLLTDPGADTSLRLLFYEQDRRYGICDLELLARSSGTVTERVEARCGALPPSIPVGLAGELLAAESGAPAHLYAQGREGSGWVQAVYDLTKGTELHRVTDRPAGGFVWRSGAVAHLASGPPVALHRFRDGSAAPPVPLAIDGEASVGPRLVWDEIVWTEPAEDGRHHVLTQRVREGEPALGERVSLGTTPRLRGTPSLEICRTSRRIALLVGGSDGRGGVNAVLAFRDESGWSPTTEVRMGTAQFGFTCRDEVATLSWIVGAEELPDLSFLGEVDTEASLPVAGRYVVHRLRCAAGHCKHDEAAVPLRRFSRTSRYVAGDAGDSMVLLWRSVRGDVRMKVAPIQLLAEAPERSLFDDVEHDGFGWDLDGDPIIGRAGYVLVMLSRQIGATHEVGTYAFVIYPSGDALPIAVRALDAPIAPL